MCKLLGICAYIVKFLYVACGVDLASCLGPVIGYEFCYPVTVVDVVVM